MEQERRLCDYEGSSYRADFWEGQGREYEDLAERIALRHLMPAAGRRLLDIGAGFGRLSEFYRGYEQVVLLDYSRSLLRQARERLGSDGRMVYVAADFYTMPFADRAIDTAMMVRVIHHVENVPSLLGEVARILTGGGDYVLEFASKRHLKAILRYALRLQAWSPFDPSPYEFVEMNFDFHPAWMWERLQEAGFHVKHRRTVSHFRLPLLKRLVPAQILAAIDSLCQPTGELWQLTPSVFAHCKLDKADAGKPASVDAIELASGGETTSGGLFRCPACRSTDLHETPEALSCKNCGRLWPVEDGIYNFKADP